MAKDYNLTNISTFSSTCNFILMGNIMTLLYGDDFVDEVSLSGKDYAFYF